MITAVDTNVLLDVFIPSDEHGPRSREWLSAAYNAGSVIVCDIVYAELVPAFTAKASLDNALREIGAALSPINSSIAFEQGCAGSCIASLADRGTGLSSTSSLAPTPRLPRMRF